MVVGGNGLADWRREADVQSAYVPGYAVQKVSDMAL